VSQAGEEQSARAESRFVPRAAPTWAGTQPPLTLFPATESAGHTDTSVTYLKITSCH